MSRVRYTADGGRYRVAGHTFEPGDDGEVSEALAAHLVDDVGEFERVDAQAAEATDGPTDETAEAAAEVDDPPDDEDEADDDLAATLADLTIDEFEDELESGRFDDRLDAVAEAEEKGKDRTGIHDAIGVRRAEIEE
jgi:hypothetical protein